MSVPCLVDTNVLIDYLRGRAEAVACLERLKGPVLISAMTVAELYVGVRNEEEQQRMAAFLAAFEVIPVTSAIAQQAGLYRRQYGDRHGTDLVDAIVAATAQERKARLLTLNRRHFPMLSRLRVPYDGQH